MTSPPPGSPASSAPQPLPHQPQPTQTKPSSTANKKPRQRKQAAQKNRSPAASSVPSIYSSSRPPVLQPYPPSPFHIMNPSYPINGSPFAQQPHHPAYPPQPSNPNLPPPHHQYAYPVHPSHYPPPHPYSHYPQYQPMMMYTAPRTSAPPDTPQSLPSPSLQSPSASGAGQKRKRRSEGARGKPGDKNSDDETGTSGTDNRPHQPPPPQQQQQQQPVDAKKRTKTQRACDSCRSRKIRCDILADAEPPRCQHCKQYGFDCTFFLPITETRFKKKKLEEEHQGAEKEKSGDSSRITVAAQTESQSKQDISVLGPTSAIHLLHSQASISSRIYEAYDTRWHYKYEVSQKDGLIQVQRPNQEEKQLSHPKPIDLRVEPETIQQLLNAYFSEVAPILPVVTRNDFLANPNPPPILLYSMCLVAAARRDVPQTVFDTIRHTVNTIIKAEDVLSTASIANVQALLILCMTGDCHSPSVSSALSALWIRLGAAIRMAQDLGLHRCESVMQNIELRRRLWAACLISDRWTSLTYGHPYMIDVQDCDARLPSSGDSNDLYIDELVRLSVILGRVLKTIYSPSGLTFTTDEQLYRLLSDLETWKTGLPEQLQFKGPTSPQSAGLLHLLYSCVSLMFWRVFMRISYTCPEHLKFALTVEKWTQLIELTGESIDWLEANENAYDIWILVPYSATSCALVQYHTWARRKDNDAALKLRKLRDCVRRWEGSISPDHMSARRKTAEIIALLYEATQGPHLPFEAPPLNPTGGVTVRQPVGLEYKKDPTRPGGGVFVARGEARQRQAEFKDVPEGVIIRGSDNGSDENGMETIQESIASVPLSDERSRDDHERAAMTSESSAFAPPLQDVGKPLGATGNGRRPAVRQSTFPSPLQTQAGEATSPSMVNITPLSRVSQANVNPTMDKRVPAGSNQVKVINTLDGAPGGGSLAEFVTVDTYLDGIPGSMFDWGQWDTFFARFNNPGQTGGNGSGGLSNLQYPQQSSAQRPQ